MSYWGVRNQLGEFAVAGRLLSLLAVAFFLTCSWRWLTAVKRISEQGDSSPTSVSQPLSGSHVLVYEFTARLAFIGKFYVFPSREQIQPLSNEVLVTELLSAPDQKVLYRLASKIAEVTFLPFQDSLVFTPNWVVEPGRRYQLRFSLPAASPDHGLSFALSAAQPDIDDQLSINGEVQAGLTLNHLILGARTSFPLVLVLVGSLLLVLVFSIQQRDGRLSALLLTSGVAFILSEYTWERDLWIFWGHYWPDGYVYVARGIFERLAQRAPFSELSAFLTQHRTGCHFLVPFIIALLHSFGLSYIVGYTLSSAAFSIGTLLLVAASVKKHWRLENEHLCFLIVLTGLHLAIIRGFVRPQSDAGGMFFTVLFVTAFTDFALASKYSRAAMWLTVTAAFLGLCTRIALLPLLAVPVALILWRYLFSKPRPRQDIALFSISLIATGCVVITFTGLYLWDSLAADYAFAKTFYTPATPANFSFPTFKHLTPWVLQLALPLAILQAKRVLTDERLTIPLITILGFEGMLLGGSWIRYWAPVAPLASAIASVLLFARYQPPRSLWLVILGLAVAGNLFFVATHPNY